ncbi:MAG: hypothetical protein IKB31_09925, partial [Bacteroidaceae bacterium]|nr:hypothetical protein [Bacteroidaceae bacterium]
NTNETFDEKGENRHFPLFLYNLEGPLKPFYCRFFSRKSLQPSESLNPKVLRMKASSFCLHLAFIS